jgi:hypothetical protein
MLGATPVVSSRDVEQLGAPPRQRVHEPNDAERKNRTHGDQQGRVGGPAGPPVGHTGAVEVRRDHRWELPEGGQHQQDEPDRENPEESASQ